MQERLYYKTANGWITEFSVHSDFHVNVSRDVDGLNDVDNKVYTTTTIGQDGESYVSGSIQARSIEITGHLRTTSPERRMALRQRLNHVMSPKQQAELIYVCGSLRRRIPCYAEAAPHYTSSRFPQFVIQLTCPDPFWKDETVEATRVAEWEGGMIFDTTDGLELADGWVIGSRTGDLIVTVTNNGDVACGMTLVFEAEGRVVNPVIRNAETLEFIRLVTEMSGGDRIEITTGYGEKAVVLTRNGAQTNLFRTLDPESTFLQMQVGDNLFACDAQENVANLTVTIRYLRRYLGV